MSLTKTMQRNAEGPAVDKAYLSERSFRSDRLVEKWSRIPEVGVGLKQLDETTARNTAIYLENQTRVMSRMTEAQLSSSFQGFSPENMLRLIRLVYSNVIRPKLFTEFAMETTKDSIKYIRPVYTTSVGGTTINRTFDANGYNTSGGQKPNDPTYRKAMYETAESRYGSELVNAQVIARTAGGYFINFGTTLADGSGVSTGANGAFALGYIDGSSAIFGAGGEKEPLAIQNKSGSWFVIPGTGVTVAGTSPLFYITGYAGGTPMGYGRYNSEADLTGTNLGEVELVMDDYQFNPRPWTLGVTMTQLTQITLDTSFGVSGEELLLDYAGQEIRRSLDYSAVKDAYIAAIGNGTNYYTEFDAEAGAGTNDSYGHTAQLISQAIERIGDNMYNDIKRGGVTRLVGGPKAISYLRLNTAFTTKGSMERNGGYQVGELYGTPVFKVPSDIIPNDEIVTIFKNPENEADVGIAYGVLVPFVSTGLIQRKNFYAEAGLATYQDKQVLNSKYFGRIKVKNIR
jgi:hypothetical protein